MACFASAVGELPPPWPKGGGGRSVRWLRSAQRRPSGVSLGAPPSWASGMLLKVGCRRALAQSRGRGVLKVQGEVRLGLELGLGSKRHDDDAPGTLAAASRLPGQAGRPRRSTTAHGEQPARETTSERGLAQDSAPATNTGTGTHGLARPWRLSRVRSHAASSARRSVSHPP